MMITQMKPKPLPFCHWWSSFIHYGNLYSTSSRLLRRSATNPCTAKKKQFSG